MLSCWRVIPGNQMLPVFQWEPNWQFSFAMLIAAGQPTRHDEAQPQQGFMARLYGFMGIKATVLSGCHEKHTINMWYLGLSENRGYINLWSLIVIGTGWCSITHWGVALCRPQMNGFSIESWYEYGGSPHRIHVPNWAKGGGYGRHFTYIIWPSSACSPSHHGKSYIV